MRQGGRKAFWKYVAEMKGAENEGGGRGKRMNR